jgi:hypothetical protein
LVEKLRADFGFPKSLSILKSSVVGDRENGIVQEIKLTATYPFESRRYHRGPFSPYELALSLKPGSYLSHGTAAYLHNLADRELGTVYANKEPSFKDSEGTLTQPGIKRAFRTNKESPATSSRTSERKSAS